jgi:glycosyltransferase involved in cell wall biosynthesis
MIGGEPVSVIVNVYNEAETIERELRELHAEVVTRLPGSELIVAEDGSTDGTKEILHRLKAELGIIHSTSDQRKGYAKAFRDAVALAQCPYVFFSDTGGKQDFRDFWKLHEHCANYGVVSGIRSGRTDQRYRRLLTYTYNFVLRRYFGVRLRDADAGFRIYRAEVIRKIAAETWVNRELITSELALRAIYSGYEIKEVPVIYRPRAGTSRGLPPGKIPGVICRVLLNFRKLKQAITAPGYRLEGRLTDSAKAA